MMGCVAAIVFSCKERNKQMENKRVDNWFGLGLGAAYRTAKSVMSLSAVGVLCPDLVLKLYCTCGDGWYLVYLWCCGLCFMIWWT
ncbi:hypothetical protein G6F43_005710 [Rhizopus delemar]|nr:hypothetical protein G6F43_005710 [Rhizopus delemar]